VLISGIKQFARCKLYFSLQNTLKLRSDILCRIVANTYESITNLQ